MEKTQICFYLLNRWVGPCYSIKLKNVKFLKFRPPSSILSEIENVGYLKNRQSDFDQILN